MTLLADSNKNSELFSKNGEQILTVITAIPNEKTCEKCHGLQKQMLGALDIDVSVTEMFRDVTRNRLRMIMILTAFSAELDEQTALELGACGYIEKPFVVDEIRELVHLVLAAR